MYRGPADVWVESDQKEIIIAELKDEIHLLRQNEKEYVLLQQQLAELEHRYRLLQQEKNILDSDFRLKHQNALRNISQLKAQTDAFRSELRQRNLQLEDLVVEGTTLKNQLDQRNIEIQRIKNDTNSILSDHEEMIKEKSRLEAQLTGLKSDKATLLQSLKNLENDNNNTKKRIVELEKYLAGLQTQGKTLKDRILQYQNENNALDGDINDIDAEIEGITKGTGDGIDKVKQLQHDVAGLQAENDKAKSTIAHLLKVHQSQCFKNNDLAKTLVQAENALRNREAQILQGQQDINGLLVECDKIGALNSQLNGDLQCLRIHLQNLSVQNSHLLIQLQRYSAEDQAVRNIIDRKPRIIRAKMRVEQTQEMSRVTTYVPPIGNSGILRRSIRLPL